MASKLGTLTLDLVCRVGNFTQAMREASSSASREMGRIESSTSSAQSMLKSLAATAAATFTVSQIVNYADSYTGMINKLKLVTENQSQLSIAMSDTHRIAQSTASEWGGVVDVYTKFQKISDRLGLSQKEVARVTETVTKAVGMSGASAEEAQRALIQFSQGLSLGVLRGQDLNSVMQQTPALTDAIAKGMGVTSDKLKQMGADNILTTESIVKALEKVAASVDADFAKTATLVSASFDLIKNEAIKMVGEFDAATGASSTFVKGMTELSENMDVAVGGLTVATAYMIGSYIPAITLGTKTLVVDTIAKVSSIAATRAKVLADYEVAKSNLAATAAMARSMGATNAQTAAMMANARAAYQQAAANKAAALSSATAFLGPVGLGLTVAAVAASYLLLKDSTDESTKSLRENNESVDEAIAKYRDLEEAKQKSQLVTEKEQLNELKEARDNATDSLITNAYALTRHNDVTAIQSKELNALIAEFKKNGDINQFSKSINALTFINQKSKDQFNKLAGTVSDTNGKYKAQKSLIDEINKLTPNAVKATDDRAAAAERERKAIEAANKAYADYSKSAFADIKEIAARKFFQEKGLS
ncbi:tape measure protein, partial [Acinetobacter sichuanensis]